MQQNVTIRAHHNKVVRLTNSWCFTRDKLSLVMYLQYAYTSPAANSPEIATANTANPVRPV